MWLFLLNKYHSYNKNLATLLPYSRIEHHLNADQQGELQNGSIVAVKMIDVSIHTIDEKLFRREFNSLTKINHENIVLFLGFCSNTYQTPIQEAGSEEINLANVRERLLCFEYVSNGNLQNYITGMRCCIWCNSSISLLSFFPCTSTFQVKVDKHKFTEQKKLK